MTRKQFEKQLYRLTHSKDLERAAARGDREAAKVAMQNMRKEVTALAKQYGIGRGQLILTLAKQEMGVTERNGSNESTRIRQYRAATPEYLTQPGQWCNYFTSFLASAAGKPVGASGKGSGYTPYTVNWAKTTGRWSDDNGKAKPGDSVLFDWGGDGGADHIGVVESVGKNGLRTIEGNSNNKVERRYRSFDTVLGYVNMSPASTGQRRGGPVDETPINHDFDTESAIEYADAPETGGQFAAAPQQVMPTTPTASSDAAAGADLAQSTAPPTAAPFVQAGV